VKDWLAMEIIEPCHIYTLNDASHDDRYCMKDINECIDNIGRARSSIFSTMDLTHGFWQLPLQKNSRPFTAFIVPGMGQYQLQAWG